MNHLPLQTAAGFAWLASKSGRPSVALDDEGRRAVSDVQPAAPQRQTPRVLSLLPKSRSDARALRAKLPPRWRLALDRARDGVPLPPPVFEALAALVASRVKSSTRSHLFGGPFDLAHVIEMLGVVGIVLGSRAASPRQRARLLRALGPGRRDRIRLLDASEPPSPVVRLCTDVLLRTRDHEGEIERRIDGIGLQLLATCAFDDEESASEIRGRLHGSTRNRWIEHVTAARTSSQRNVFPEVRAYFEECLQ